MFSINGKASLEGSLCMSTCCSPDAELEAMMVSSELSGREECQDTIKGYIRLVQANDKPIFINNKYIVFIEPVTLNRFHHTKGSLITLSVNGTEGLQTIKVVEPCEVVMKSIAQSKGDNPE